MNLLPSRHDWPAKPLVRLLQLDQPHVGPQCVAHDLLHGLGTSVGVEIAKGDAGVTGNLRQHGEESPVPARNGTTGTSTSGDRNHRTSDG
jgi:hypothetical protein